MLGNQLLQIFIISCSFVCALMLEIMPFPSYIEYCRPSWLLLVLIFWLATEPNKINIGTAFLLGLIWDLILGSTLGVHSLVLSIFAYIVVLQHRFFLNHLSLLQQCILIIIASILIKFIIFGIESFLYQASFNLGMLIGSLLTGLLWPWIYLALNKIRLQINLQ